MEKCVTFQQCSRSYRASSQAREWHRWPFDLHCSQWHILLCLVFITLLKYTKLFLAQRNIKFSCILPADYSLLTSESEDSVLLKWNLAKLTLKFDVKVTKAGYGSAYL